MDDKAESVVAKAERDYQEREARRFIGQVFGGNYKITGLIGIGGMSYVLKALDESLGREVAVKVLLQDFLGREDMVKRFLNEAKTIASLTDKRHVVEIHSIGMFSFEGQERPWPYYVMQYLPGEDLEQIMNDRFDNGQEFTLQEIYAIMSQVLEGLQSAHDAGVIHRDLKPGNIKMASTGREIRVKIVDFGISRTLAGEGKSVSGLTQDGQFFGTPHIVPPEQIRAEHHRINACSDIYSAGCMLFCLLTGSYPFEHESPGQVISMQLNDPPPRPSELRSGLNSELVDAVVLKALEKEPEKRWANALEFKAALKKAVGGRDITTAHSLIPLVFDDRENGSESSLSDADSTAVSQDFDVRPPAAVDIEVTGPTVLAPSHPPEPPREEADPESDDAAKRTLLGTILAGGVVLMAIVFVVWLGLVLGKRSCGHDDDTMAESVPAPLADQPEVVIPQVPEVEEEVEEEFEEEPEEEPTPYLVEKVGSESTSAKPKAVTYHDLARHDQTSWSGIQKYLGNKSNCLRARPTLEILVKHEPNFPDAHFYLAECYRRSKKQKHKATYHYKKFLQLAPGHEWAPKAKKYVH
ncbi:protein kinase [Candidatus Saccharibacteria bacterium]|nr:protein kinase [Candidatus Saccharibacteria bacterium]NIV04184.1 protein kinase [Calditrichia bacterium]NIS38335.1 protein kinase [Candidatus Saccharibacteria bacterium]NIV72120.1 protein kinase [Calditrichia bacterium]NIV99008.1 protein kinase [Candidatus Saccharibacteria bacterium]